MYIQLKFNSPSLFTSVIFENREIRGICLIFASNNFGQKILLYNYSVRKLTFLEISCHKEKSIFFLFLLDSSSRNNLKFQEMCQKYY